MESLVYSPTRKLSIECFNEKSLQDLKYHQLLKLSSKYNIKKRWAKKDDLINCLMAVKSTGTLQTTQEAIINEKVKWTDGQEMFKHDSEPVNKTSEPRSTFIVEKKLIDSRGTYNLSSAFNDLLPDLRINDSRLTFDIPKRDNVALAQNSKQNIKMLTVPMNNRLSRVSTNKLKSLKESPLKLSNKSISIKKTKDILSPMKSSRILNSELKRPVLHTKTPIRHAALTSLNPEKPITLQKENLKVEIRSSFRRKSKSDDPIERRRLSMKAQTPVQSSKTPPAGPSIKLPSTTKAADMSRVKLSTYKIPNFAAIHQRQFNKLDSLDEYINKKSDRVKKLFGTPTQFHTTEKVSSQVKPTNEEKDTSSKNAKHSRTTMESARRLINRNPQLRTMTDVKDRNRSHIHGIRSNKRFELQMKFRNMAS